MDKEVVHKLLNGIKYSASPRLTIKYCKQVLEIDPGNAEAHYKLAQAYRDTANTVVQADEEKEFYQELAKKNFKIAEKLGYDAAAGKAER